MKIVSDRKRMVKYNGRWILNGKDDEEEDVSLSSAASGESVSSWRLLAIIS